MVAPVEADQERRRRVRDRAHRGRGKAGLAGRPAVVTTWTAAPSRLIASRNCGTGTVATGSGPIASKAPAMASSGRWSFQFMEQR